MDRTQLLNLLPGAAQGVVRVLVSHPVDYVRTHLQKGSGGVRGLRDYFSSARARGLSPLHVFGGIKFPLTVVPIDRALSYWIYETLRTHQISSFPAALASGACSALYQTPLQAVCAHYVLGHTRAPAAQFIRQLGASIMWRGLGVEYLRGVIGSTVFMGTYGALRDRAVPNPDLAPNSIPWAATACAIGASTATWTVTYPIETLRLEHQTTPLSPSVLATLRTRIATQGWRSLYRGIGLVYARSAPSAALGMLVYELVRAGIND